MAAGITSCQANPPDDHCQAESWQTQIVIEVSWRRIGVVRMVIHADNEWEKWHDDASVWVR